MILDTNALSAFVDGDAKVGAILTRQYRAAIPVIVLGEFRYGILGSRHRSHYEQWLALHLDNFEILPVNAETAVAYAAFRDTLKKLARPVPANDAWIAALAIQHGLAILTRDEHFANLPDVTRISW